MGHYDEQYEEERKKDFVDPNFTDILNKIGSQTLFQSSHIVPSTEELPIEAQKNAGLRYDQGKIRWDLVPPDAMLEIARIYTRGAEKYAPRNWELGMDWGKCLRALKSHLNKWELGETFDDELTDCRNMAMVAWNAMALLSYEMRKIGKDDRVDFTKKD